MDCLNESTPDVFVPLMDKCFILVKDLSDCDRGGKSAKDELKILGLQRFENLCVFRGKWMGFLYPRLCLVIKGLISEFPPDGLARAVADQDTSFFKRTFHFVPRGKL